MVNLFGQFAEPLVALGLVALILIIIILLANAYVGIRDSVKLRIKKYRDRHKFEKPPTAKCYCIACGLWYADSEERLSGRCGSWDGYHTCADEFCSRGYLRDDSGYDNEKWRLGDS